MLKDLGPEGTHLGRMYSSLSLTDEDRNQLRSLMEHPGWKVVTDKVFPARQLELLIQCQGVLDAGHKIMASGRYEGVVLAEESIVKASEPPKAPRVRQGPVY